MSINEPDWAPLLSKREMEVQEFQTNVESFSKDLQSRFEVDRLNSEFIRTDHSPTHSSWNMFGPVKMGGKTSYINFIAAIKLDLDGGIKWYISSDPKSEPPGRYNQPLHGEWGLKDVQ